MTIYNIVNKKCIPIKLSLNNGDLQRTVTSLHLSSVSKTHDAGLSQLEGDGDAYCI